MDFFEAQARAKKRTSRLLALFALAVGGTIAATYFVTIFGLRYAEEYQPRRSGEAIHEIERSRGAAQTPFWQPRIFSWVSLGTLAVVGAASFYKWREYAGGGHVVAESLGGRRVDPQTTNLHERRLLNVVEEMAIAAGTPVPGVYVLDEEPAINAFAAGLTTSDAVVAVTRGALEKLTRDELQGVIGHEFSHILNGDMRLNLRIAAIVFGILVLGLAGRGILWSLRHTRVRSSRGKNGGGVLLALAAAGLALLIIGYVGYFFGRIIQAAVSRQREFLADASAVQFTRNPGGMTGALKKIGGYALGSKMLAANSAAVGHFFFAQAFRSGFIGLWSTHPPLPDRIRAIEPQFDGAMFEPEEKVDVASESFVTAGLAPPPIHRQPPPLPALKLSPATATAAIASVGTLAPEQIANAHLLLESTPPRLRDAAHRADEAAPLVYAILLADDPAVRTPQRKMIAARGGSAILRIVDELAAQPMRPEQKLPLLQLTLPVLRHIARTELDAFLDTLDELVHADAQVSTFEFALQKLLVHTLALGRTPGAAVVQYHSFHAVADEISLVLSALAHAATADAASARHAFGVGTSQLKLIENRLAFVDARAADLAALDGALDNLGRASGVIKQRTLVAAAHVVGADGQLLVTEAELLRAVAAALDCPMPPLRA